MTRKEWLKTIPFWIAISLAACIGWREGALMWAIICPILVTAFGVLVSWLKYQAMMG